MKTTLIIIGFFFLAIILMLLNVIGRMKEEADNAKAEPAPVYNIIQQDPWCVEHDCKG